MAEIKRIACLFGGYWRWCGPPNIRAHNLCTLRMELMCLCALYRQERKEQMK